MSVSNAQLDAICRGVVLSGTGTADNIYDSNPLFTKLKSRNRIVNGGNELIENIRYEKNQASGWFNPHASFSTNPNDFIRKAYWDYGYCRSTVTLFESDLAKCNGAEQYVNLMTESVGNGMDTINDLAGTELYGNGTTTNGWQGLRLITDASETLGGLAPGTYTWWVPGVEDATTSAFSPSALRANIGAATKNSVRPQIISTTRVIYDDIRDYYESAKIAIQDDKVLTTAGFENVMFDGIPIVVDSHCTAAYLFGFNIDKGIRFVVNQAGNMQIGKFKDMEVAGLWAKTATIYLMAGITVPQRRLFFCMSNLPTS